MLLFLWRSPTNAAVLAVRVGPFPELEAVRQSAQDLDSDNMLDLGDIAM